MIHEASTLVETAIRAIPDAPVPFRNAGIQGFGWAMPEGRIGYLGIDEDGRPCAGDFEVRGDKEVPASARVAGILHGWRLGDDSAGRFDPRRLSLPHGASPWTGPERDAFRARLLASVDLEALAAVSAGGRPWTPSEYGWVSYGTGRARRLRIATAWPWAVGHLAKAEFLGTVDEGVEDDQTLVAEALVTANRSLGLPANAEAARMLLHPLATPAMLDLSSHDAFARLAAASAFPPSWLPAAPPEGNARRRSVFASEVRAFLALAALVRDYALATDQRTVDCIALEGEGWSAALRRHLDRAGLDADMPDPAVASFHLSSRIGDMVCAFQHQLLETAVIATVPGSKATVRGPRLVLPSALAGVVWSDKGMAEVHGATTKAAIKLLARNKSLAGMAELSRDWHNNLGDVAAVAARAARGRTWPKAFKDRVAPNGFSLRCLTTPAQLLEEGVAMDNCVATYVGACLIRSCVIVSVRDAGGVPRATVELVRGDDGGVVVVQASGPRNAVPSAEASAAVAYLRDGISTGAIPVAERALGERNPFMYEIPSLPGYADMLDDIVKAWAPFLARDMRGLAPAAYVAASGYDAAAHALLIEREYGERAAGWR